MNKSKKNKIYYKYTTMLKLYKIAYSLVKIHYRLGYSLTDACDFKRQS